MGIRSIFFSFLFPHNACDLLGPPCLHFFQKEKRPSSLNSETGETLVARPAYAGPTRVVLGSAPGPCTAAQLRDSAHAVLPRQHLQTPVTRLGPNQHLVVSTDSSPSGHTLGLSQEKCQPLLGEPRANGLGIRLHLLLWASQEPPQFCLRGYQA